MEKQAIDVFRTLEVPNEHPTHCNLCKQESVELINNKRIYGKTYGNGKMYYCNHCQGRVGTHRDGRALGILADYQMRNLKMECHTIFDPCWKTKKMTRKEAYKKLASELGIKTGHCHFGWFDLDQLTVALHKLKQWKEPEEVYP